MLSPMTLLLDGRMGGGAAGMMMRGGGGGFLIGGLGNLLSTVLIVLAVLWVVKNWTQIKGWLNNATASLKNSVSSATNSGPAPLEVVQMRYAKGEISKEEYETLRNDLSGEGTPIPVSEAPANG